MFLSNIFSLFKTKNTNEIKRIEPTLDDLKTYDFSNVNGTSVEGNVDSDKVLLIMDDVLLSKVLIESDLRAITDNYNFNVYDQYKVVWCLGSTCGLATYKYILMDKQPVTHVLFDITLGEHIRYNNKSYFISGVSLLIHILKHNKDIKFKFITAHNMNNETQYITDLCKLFYNELHLDINDFVINKNSLSRCDEIYNFIT